MELKLSDRIEQADRRVVTEEITSSSIAIAATNVAIEAIRIELEPNILVDLAVDINTSIVDLELVAILSAVRRSVLDPVEAGTDTHAD